MPCKFKCAKRIQKLERYSHKFVFGQRLVTVEGIIIQLHIFSNLLEEDRRSLCLVHLKHSSTISFTLNIEMNSFAAQMFVTLNSPQFSNKLQTV